MADDDCHTDDEGEGEERRTASWLALAAAVSVRAAGQHGLGRRRAPGRALHCPTTHVQLSRHQCRTFEKHPCSPTNAVRRPSSGRPVDDAPYCVWVMWDRRGAVGGTRDGIVTFLSHNNQSMSCGIPILASPSVGVCAQSTEHRPWCALVHVVVVGAESDGRVLRERRASEIEWRQRMKERCL